MKEPCFFSLLWLFLSLKGCVFGEKLLTLQKIVKPHYHSMQRILRAVVLAAMLLASVAVPQALQAQEEFRRNLEQIAFVPKGQWITGVSVSYSQSSQDNYQFFVVENLSGNTYTFKVSPMVMFAFKENLAAGGRFAYSRQRTKLDAARVVIDSETDYNVDNLYSISHNFYGTAAFRNYISLGHSTRFGLFNEVQMQFGGGESKLCNGSGLDFTGTFERSFSLDVGLAPGMAVFLSNYSALEVNVGVLGFSYQRTRSTTDRIYVAERNHKSANFKINLFSITFGVSFYI